jgi:DNA-binding transcriptional LysR family regulator
MMDGSDVDDIMAFMAVVDAKGFAAGGRSLGLSRSAAGKAVARLERKYAIRLLNRNTRHIALTDGGYALYQKGLEIATVLQQVEEGLGGGTEQPTGTLRLTVPDAFGRLCILPVVQDYLESWPRLQVEINLSDTVVNMVQRGFDLAVRIGVTSPEPGMIMRHLRDEPLALCAAPAYLERCGIPENIEELDRHDLLFYEHDGERQSWILYDEERRPTPARGRSRLRMDNGAALYTMALAQAGIALLPSFLVKEDLADGRLKQVLAHATPKSVPVVALYPHRRYLEAKTRHFIDMLAGALKD